MNNLYLVQLLTIFKKEFARWSRIWIQTILPSVITMFLYITIFGNFIGERVGEISGLPYIHFIIPGLIIMPIISNSYMNVVGSFYSGRFQKSIEELFVSPLSSHVILIGYVLGGVSRAFVVGFVVYIVSLSFTTIPIHNVALALFLTLLISFLFSILGFINAVYAKSFDDINIIPTFVLTPLTYLGGTFYSIYNLPEVWQTVSIFNPIAYMVSAYRYAFIGVEEMNTYAAILMMFILIFVLYSLAIYLLNKGIGVKN